MKYCKKVERYVVHLIYCTFNDSYDWYIHTSLNNIAWLIQPFFLNAFILKVIYFIAIDNPIILWITIFMWLLQPLLFFPCFPRLVATWSEYIGPRPKAHTLALGNTIYYFRLYLSVTFIFRELLSFIKANWQ